MENCLRVNWQENSKTRSTFFANVLESSVEGAKGRVATLETACTIVAAAAGLRNVQEQLELIEAYLADENVETEA